MTPANHISESGMGVGIAAGKPKNFEKASCSRSSVVTMRRMLRISGA
jgi:hypothetical protein